MEHHPDIVYDPDSVLYPTSEIPAGQLPPFLERAISIASTFSSFSFQKSHICARFYLK